MKKTIIPLALGLILWPTILLSQASKKMFLTDVFEMATDPDNKQETLTFTNVEFSLETLKNPEYVDMGFFSEAEFVTLQAYLFSVKDSLQFERDEKGRIIIGKEIRFINCSFPAVSIRDINFSKGLFVRSAKPLTNYPEYDERLMQFFNCNFDFLNLKAENDLYEIFIYQCSIGRLALYEIPSITLTGSKVNSMVIQYVNIPAGFISMTGNEFLIQPPITEKEPFDIDPAFGEFVTMDVDSVIAAVTYGRNGTDLRYQIVGSQYEYLKTGSLGSFEFSNNQLVSDNQHKVVDFTVDNLTVDNLIINNNHFGFDFNLIKVAVVLKSVIQDNIIDDKFGVTQVSFSETQNMVEWSQFNGFKLALRENLNAEDNPLRYGMFNVVPYYAENDRELESIKSFEMLIASYRSIYEIYKFRGDIESANACYSEMKDVQTRRLNYIYRTKGGLKNWFKWKLNQLMKIYTEHGTDPTKAILISFYILLGFAVFYFFFPSEWDVSSKQNLIKNVKSAIDSSQRGTAKSVARASWLLVVSFINAITLSLNAFVTLGFGTIPTTGIARYVCVLQGFLGWFLLSLFSVALINQVLF